MRLKQLSRTALRQIDSVGLGCLKSFPVLASYCPAPAASAKGSDEAEIKTLEQRIADAANAKDPDAIMKNYLGGEGLFVFDVIPPRQYVGADAFHKDWEGFFGRFDGPITFENSDMTVESDGLAQSALRDASTMPQSGRYPTSPLAFAMRPSRDKSSLVLGC